MICESVDLMSSLIIKSIKNLTHSTLYHLKVSKKRVLSIMQTLLMTYIESMPFLAFGYTDFGTAK